MVELEPETGKEVWEYRGRPTWTFFSPNISGAQRLASGNTLISSHGGSRVVEVDRTGKVVNEHATNHQNVWRVHRR